MYHCISFGGLVRPLVGWSVVPLVHLSICPSVCPKYISTRVGPTVGRLVGRTIGASVHPSVRLSKVRWYVRLSKVHWYVFDMSSHLYWKVGPSISGLVRWSICPSVRPKCIGMFVLTCPHISIGRLVYPLVSWLVG